MIKPSVTVHQSLKGDVKVLECSNDATKCLKAYYNCSEPGEVCYIRKGFLDKRKKIPAEVKAKPAKKSAKA